MRQRFPYLKKALTKELDLHKIAEMVRTRIEVYPEITDMVSFFETLPEYDTDLFTNKKSKNNAETAARRFRHCFRGLRHRRPSPMMRFLRC